MRFASLRWCAGPRQSPGKQDAVYRRIPDRLEGSKTNWTRMDADQAGWARAARRGRALRAPRHGADAAGKRTRVSRPAAAPPGALSRGIRTMTLEREALVRDEPRGPILPASLGRFLDRCWSRKSAYFQRSSALLCLFLVYPADRSPTAQFGQDRDFAVTLRWCVRCWQVGRHAGENNLPRPGRRLSETYAPSGGFTGVLVVHGIRGPAHPHPSQRGWTVHGGADLRFRGGCGNERLFHQRPRHGRRPPARRATGRAVGNRVRPERRIDDGFRGPRAAHPRPLC